MIVRSTLKNTKLLEDFGMAQLKGGATSASLLILILVATAVGAIAGLALDGTVTATRTLAISAGLLAVIVASIARYKLVFLGAGVGSDESRVPMVLLVNAAVASIAGSLAAHDLTNFLAVAPSGAMLGAMAGLLSAVLMAMLMVTYHMNPSPSR